MVAEAIEMRFFGYLRVVNTKEDKSEAPILHYMHTHRRSTSKISTFRPNKIRSELVRLPAVDARWRSIISTPTLSWCLEGYINELQKLHVLNNGWLMQLMLFMHYKS